MKLYQIPDQVRQQEYYDTYDRCLYKGDQGKCGGCNWETDTVWMLGNTPQDAIIAFKHNHRGLCGDCMCELISEAEREVGNGL